MSRSEAGHCCHLYFYSKFGVGLSLEATVDGLHGLVVVERAAVAEQEDGLLGAGEAAVDEGAEVVHVGCFGHVEARCIPWYLLEPLPSRLYGMLCSQRVTRTLSSMSFKMGLSACIFIIL